MHGFYILLRAYPDLMHVPFRGLDVVDAPQLVDFFARRAIPDPGCPVLTAGDDTRAVR